MRRLKRILKKVPGARRAVATIRDRTSGTARRKVPPGWSGPRGPRAEEFHRERILWRDEGPTEELLARARQSLASPAAWRRLDPRVWLVYGGAFVEAGDHAAAEQLIRRFIAREPAAALARCLPLAQFARGLGVHSPEVERAAETADVLLTTTECSSLRRLTEGRTVAVVGNGSSPIGARRGAEIDSHDIVIRFNNFPSGHEHDLGRRTDVWVRGAHHDVNDRYAVEELELVVWEMDLFRNLLEHPSHAGILHRDTQFAPKKIAFVGTETKRSLRTASGLRLPSSGAQLLWALYQARGTLAGVSTYGFSTIEGSGDHGHFFDTLGDLGTRHDVEGEGAFFRNLLATGPDAATSGSSPAVHAPSLPRDRLHGLRSRHDAVRSRPQRPPRPDAPLTIVSGAYREYDPAAGKTGGPAGVLATQQRALGIEHAGHRLEYLFRVGNAKALRHKYAVEVAGLSTKTAEIIVGAEYLRASGPVARARAEGRRLAFVCHDLGTAYGAYLLGFPYVIVYHGQGSTLRELRSIGADPTEHEVAVASRLERLVCSHASAMYFPSDGAREAFVATSGIDPATLPLADGALYNTVSAVDHDANPTRGSRIAALMRAYRLPPKSPDVDVFVTVGDYNHDKGVDRVPALLDRYVLLTGRRVLWVAVGRAADPELFAGLKASQSSWSFDSYLIGERMDHDLLLALLDYGDYYLMLHRAAIFDLATLEAMRAALPVILSPVGGNIEVGIDDNVVFAMESTFDAACDRIVSRDRQEWGSRNRRVFEEYFSLENFTRRYRSMLDVLVKDANRAERAMG